MPELIDESIRLQVLLERVKAGEDKQIDAFLRDVDTVLRDRLTGAELTANQRDRIEAKLEEIRAALAVLQDRKSADFLRRMDALAEAVADTEAKSLAAALDGLETAVPGAATIRAAATGAPLSVRGPGGGMILAKFIEKHDEATLDRIEGVIRRGFFEGRTTDQIVRDLRGTKAAGYADGVLSESRRHARTVAHTALQHMAHVARAEAWKANEDIIAGYRWISTLDSKTSEVCQSLDGQVFQIGTGPLPPAHPNCRSTVAAVTKTFRELGIDVDEMPEGSRASIGGQVNAGLTYFEWLKTQPASFVDDALGPKRAALFLKGGISAEEFGRLQLGRNFEPLTLEEMRRAAPKVFERAGV